MAEIQKQELTSMNIAEEQLRKLKELFPEAFTEGLKVDWDKLRLTLGQSIDVGKERYGMNWPGKADCFKTIQQQSIATLIPARDESVDFDKTENLFIEGDNLEVLKLLQKSYLGKIKFMYFDPPYNTGSDFIYPDNYSESLDTYLEYTGQVDADGKKFGTNTDTDGRFHSKWMNMMYPRLFLAKNLLKDDGVLFIQIGEEELCNLEKICNDIFGEENKLSIITRVAKTASNLGTHFALSTDFILAYAKNKSILPPLMDEVDESLYKKTEIDGPRKGEKYRDDVAFYQSSLKDIRPNQKYFIECPDGSKVIPPCSIQDEVMREGDGRWRWSKEKYLKDKDLLVFKQTKSSPLVDENGNKAKWNIYTKSYLTDRQETGTLPRNIFNDFINRKGADRLKRYDISFDFSKPIELMSYLMKIVGLKENDICLDIFAGSASTAHSVLDYSFNNNLNIKYISIQLPETIEKSEFKTIADLGKERLRRVIKEIKVLIQAQKEKEAATIFGDSDKYKLDLGFKVFKLSKSNFKIWDSTLEKEPEVIQAKLFEHIQHISPEAEQEAILYELLLKSGFELTTPIEKLTLAGLTVFSIAEGQLLICLEKELTHDCIKAMAEMQPTRVICLDEGFKGENADALKTNAVQIMKSKGVVNFRTV